MEYIQGTTLDVHVREARAGLREILRLVRQTAEAVEYGQPRHHPQGSETFQQVLVVHGQVKVVDFGLAQPWRPEEMPESSSSGTLHYMAPEQIRGDAGAVSPLGGCLCAGGHALPPAHGRACSCAPCRGALRAPASEPPRNLQTLKRDLPGDISNLLLKALSMDPERRYPSAGEFARDIGRYRKTVSAGSGLSGVAYQA